MQVIVRAEVKSAWGLSARERRERICMIQDMRDPGFFTFGGGPTAKRDSCLGRFEFDFVLGRGDGLYLYAGEGESLGRLAGESSSGEGLLVREGSVKV